MVRFYILLFGFSSCSIFYATSGIWETSCIKQSTSSKKYRIEFKKGSVLYYSEKLFGGSKCELLWNEYKIHTHYSHSASENPKLIPIDYKINEVFFTPMDKDYALKLNGVKYCGFSDWAAGVPKPVSGSLCKNTFQEPGGSFYHLYSIIDNTLFVGKLTAPLNGSTPELRPKELLLEMPFFPESFNLL